MSLMDKIITFFKNGGQWSYSKGDSKTWSGEKTWSLKKGDDATKTPPSGDTQAR